jgi:3-dehydroquinate dehydratase-2
VKVLVVNGPNLNMLGKRDPAQYGTVTLDEINARIDQRARELAVNVEPFQSNSEGALIDFIQKAASGADGIIINAGAYTHYSYALHDALLDTRLPVIEVHLSNIGARDEWRRRSVISPATRGSISGFSWRSYTAALDLLVAMHQEKAPAP